MSWQGIWSVVAGPEFWGAVTGIGSVYLTARNNIWNWWWGVANVVIYGYVFIHSHLYADATLQLAYYLPVQFYGWWVWKRAGPRRDDDLPVTRMTARAVIVALLTLVAGSAAWGWLLLAHTDDPQPWLDAALAAASVVAQYLDVVKKLESWYLWIAVDVFSAAYLYPRQHLYVTAGLYAVFLVIAVVGLLRWRRLTLRAASVPAPGVAA